MKQIFDAAADLVDLAVQIHVSKAMGTFSHHVGSIFCQSCEAVLNVFKQTHSAVLRRWWIQNANEDNRQKSHPQDPQQ